MQNRLEDSPVGQVQHRNIQGCCCCCCWGPVPQITAHKHQMAACSRRCVAGARQHGSCVLLLLVCAAVDDGQAACCWGGRGPVQPVKCAS